jgi:4-carboxymuconolactone decarboxylase
MANRYTDFVGADASEEFGMRSLFTTMASLFLVAASSAQAEQKTMSMSDDVRMVAPGLEKYAAGPIADLWKRPGLSPRDRSIVTLSALIARSQSHSLREGIYRALDNDVKPREISEIITHLAFYSGWSNAMEAVEAAKYVFTELKIAPDQLPPASPSLLPLDAEADAQRANAVSAQFGKIAPGVVQYTTEVLFHDLWLRPDLAPRDRSLVTISALIASGQVAQLSSHLTRAMNNGLTSTEVGEALTQLAFYAGWPNVFTALPIVKDVIDKRLE